MYYKKKLNINSPANIGTKDNSAGDTQVFKIIIATTRFVILVGYFKGRTMAQYLELETMTKISQTQEYGK